MPSTALVQRRACDTCYALKAKCVFAADKTECTRCLRLSRQCTTQRAHRPAGRPSKALKVKDSSIPPALHPFGAIWRRLKPGDDFILLRCLDIENVTEFVTIPRVAPLMHQEAVHYFMHNFDDVHEGIFSMYSALSAVRGDPPPGYDADTNMARGTTALKKFSDTPAPQTEEEFAPWSLLALSVIIYAHCALGSSAAPVRRRLLSGLLQMGERAEKVKHHPILVSHMMLDIYESLLYQQMPTMNIPEGHPLGTDSFFGVAVELWRFLYDIAVLNVERQYATISKDTYDARLDMVKQSAEAWQPAASQDFIASLNKDEAIQFFTQIKVQRALVLLVIHRMKYAFGCEDSFATTIASSIISDLELATTMMNKPPAFVSMPFVMAAMEETDPVQRQALLAEVETYGDALSPKSHEMSKTFLQAFWKARDRDLGLRWIDMMEQLPTINMYY